MERKKPAGPPNADQLRKAIDEGRTGDKVAFPDPAAAPLGTDAEAAGAPPSGGERRQALAAEVAAVPTSRQSAGALPLVLGFLALVLVSAVLTWLILAWR
jgi:hypothetical protein